MDGKETAPRKRFRLKFSHVLIMLLVAGIGSFALFRLHLKSKLQARIDVIRAADYPVTCAELDKWYAIPENAENAADTIMDAFWCYKETDKTNALPLIGQAKLPARTEPLPEEMKASLEKYIADNKEALKLLYKAATIEHYRYPIDLSSVNANLNHLSKLRKCMILLKIEAIWYAENGHSQSATDSMITSLNIARPFVREPLYISQVVRMAYHGLTISSLERCINRTAFTDEQLAGLNRCLIDTEDNSTLFRAYVGDRCYILEILKKPETLEPEVTIDGKQISPMNAIFSELYKAAGLADMEAIIYLDFIDRYIEITKLPAYQRKKASDVLEARLASLSHIHIFIHMFMPTISRIVTIELSSIAGLRAARAGLAVERYRLAAGKLPDSLSDLVPAYLESVPKDPFDGKELRYKKLETGFVVYSIGEDLSDDGGREKTKESENWDITFIVER